MALSAKQIHYLAHSTKRVNLAEGSIRSGKTYTSLVRWLTYIATDAPTQGALVMVGQSRDSLYRNVFEPLENDPALSAFSSQIHYRQGAPTARILGRTVHIVGATDAKAEPRIRGMTVAGAYVDELTTLPHDFFKQLLGRMSVTGACLFATTNPDSPGHWLRTEYMDRLSELPDWCSWHFTMDDNPGLTDDYKASLKREYKGLWYRRFINGEWVAAEGAVYETFDNERHVLKALDLPAMDQVLMVGVDYGTNHATRGYLLGLGQHPHKPGAQALFLLSEWAPGRTTVGKHAKLLETWLAEQPQEPWRSPRWIAVDPAAAVFREELREGPLRSRVMKAHNAVLSGIQVVDSLLASDHLFISDQCAHLIKALPGYRWDEAASKRGETRPLKVDDDEVDAMRYTIYTARQQWRRAIPLAAAASGAEQESDEVV